MTTIGSDETTRGGTRNRPTLARRSGRGHQAGDRGSTGNRAYRRPTEGVERRRGRGGPAEPIGALRTRGRGLFSALNGVFIPDNDIEIHEIDVISYEIDVFSRLSGVASLAFAAWC
jgi:hypothetical protein